MLVEPANRRPDLDKIPALIQGTKHDSDDSLSNVFIGVQKTYNSMVAVAIRKNQQELVVW